MGHFIQAVIAKSDVVLKIAKGLPGAATEVVQQGFSLLPITDRLRESILKQVHDRKEDPYEEFDFLSAPLVERIEQWSFHGKLAYIETEYFGGVGCQSAAVWENGILIVAPQRSVAESENTQYTLPSSGLGAINQALARLGVLQAGQQDEFDMLELGNYRNMDRWENG